MISIELNPILVREVRARWRKWPAIAVVFGFTTFLAAVVGWRYAEFASRTTTFHFTDQRGAELGHDLFLALTVTQVIGWMLLAPLLTATGLVSEREQDMLEGLQISGLTAKQIINGKMLSTLSFVALMLLAPLPIIAVCFLLGGVSPAELIIATLMLFMTALTCGIIGLNCAAWNYHRGIVLAKTFLGVFAWNFLPCFTLSTPMITIVYLTSNGPGISGVGSMVIFSLLAQIGLLWFLWRNAIKGLERPLSHQTTTVRKSVTLYTPTPYDLAIDNVAPITRVSLPLLSRLQFSNPLLLREVRRKLRVRWAILNHLLITEEKVALSLCLWVCLLPGIMNPGVNYVIYWIIAWLGLSGVLIAGAVLGSEAFAREREAKTWEALLLTPLSRYEIISGKLGAIFFTCFYYTLPLLLILLISVRSLTFYPPSYPYQRDTISLMHLASVVLIAGSALWCWSALGLLVSWLCKRVWVATSWTIAIILFAFIFCPFLMNLPEYSRRGKMFEIFNPWTTLVTIQYSRFESVLLSAAALFTIGSLCLGLLYAMITVSAKRMAK